MTGDDHALARDLAGQAGTRLLELRAQGGDPDVLRKAGDRLSHEFLTAELAARRPGDVVLSEEGADNPGAAGRAPGLDRRPAGRHQGVRRAGPHRLGRPRGPVGRAAATSPPARSRCPPRAWSCPRSSRRQGRRDDAATARIRIVVSRSRPPGFVRNISDLIDAELVPLGSAGAKVAAVINGEVDAYVHGGGFYEWDTAAPVAVARAAGFHASRIDGSAARVQPGRPADAGYPGVPARGRGHAPASDPGSHPCALITRCPSSTCSRPRPSTSCARSPPSSSGPPCCSPAARTRS